jgi:hypothetical protein
MVRKKIIKKTLSPKRNSAGEKEFEKYIQNLEDPNYQGGS